MTAAAQQAVDGPLLSALQLVRAVLLDGRPKEHVKDATGPTGDVLDLYRDFAADADTRREIAPTVRALAALSVALLWALNETAERVEEWLRVRSQTLKDHLAAAEAAHDPEPIVVAAASVLAEELREPDDPEQHERRARRVEILVADWVRVEHGPADRYELLLSAAELAAWLLATAMGEDQQRAEAYLDSHSRLIISRNGRPTAGT